MLNSETVEKLRSMNLSAMARYFDNQLADANISSLTFEERFGILVDVEWTTRRNNQLKRLIKSANYSQSNAALEDIDYASDRNLDKALIERLSSCDYILKCRNIILLGATGSGKTYISNALGMKASRNFITVKYIRLPELLADLAISRSEGTYKKVLKVYKSVRLLIIDEWLLTPLKDTEARDLLEITEGRYHKGSTIFCSQFDVKGWHEKIGDPTLADAIVDRIVHDAYTIIIGGKESMRKKNGFNQVD
jgi:DNA replication protein DnaC